MNEEAVRRVLDELTALYGETEGEPRTVMEVGHPAHIFISGNPLGLVSLALTCLKAVAGDVHAADATRQRVTFDERHFQLVDKSTQKYLGWIERQEQIPASAEVLAARQRPMHMRDRVAAVGCALAGFTTLFLLISGFIFWVAILADNPKWLP